MDDRLKPIYEQLKHVECRLDEYTRTGSYTHYELLELQEKLRKIEQNRKDGKFVSDTGDDIPRGQAMLHSMVHKCHRKIHNMLIYLEEVDEDRECNQMLRELEGLKCSLDDMKHTHRQSDELLQIQLKLRDVENQLNAAEVQRVKEGKVGWPGQAYLHELLEYCYDIAHHLYDPCFVEMDESLSKMKLDLDAVWRTLHEYHRQAGKTQMMFTSRDLEYNRNILLAIDAKRKFNAVIPEGRSTRDIPGGQAVVSSMLHKCYRVLHMLEAATEVDPELFSLSSQLEEIRHQLQRLVTESKTKKRPQEREKLVDELQMLQNGLDEIERQRDPHKAAFVFKGDKIPHGQAYLHNLLSSSYELVNRLNHDLCA